MAEVSRYVRERVVPFLKAIAAPSWLPVLIPVLVFLRHAGLFRGWIVDDAGITFSYARSLAQGYGLVPQPGVPPVEGYSNFLWVVLFAPFFLLNRFDPTATPKAVSYLLVIGSFAVVRRVLRHFGDDWGGITFVVLMLLALNTSFVAWSVSGLENPLSVFLLCLLLWLSLEAVRGERIASWQGAAAGLCAAAAAMTRPEGVLYFIAYPLIVLLAQFGRPRGFGRWLKSYLLPYSLALALCFGGFLVFRVIYFGDLLPNTYYAKGGPFRPALSSFGDGHDRIPYRFVDVLGSVAGRRLWTDYGSQPAMEYPYLLKTAAGRRSFLLALSLVALTAYLGFTKRLGRQHLALLLFFCLAALAYLLLPPDWMEEYRYATAFFVFWYTYLAVAVVEVVRGIKVEPPARVGIAAALAVLAIGLTQSVYRPRSRIFAFNPTVPLSGVRDWLAERFNGYADMLGIEDGSLLVPDLGGTLYYSRLRIYDLGMLCDKTIARTMGRDQPAFYDYVFEVAKPTFIHTHGSWTQRAALDQDARFRRDYLPLQERRDPWASSTAGHVMYSGDYVRKDAVGDREAGLARIRDELASPWWSRGEDRRGARGRGALRPRVQRGRRMRRGR